MDVTYKINDIKNCEVYLYERVIDGALLVINPTDGSRYIVAYNEDNQKRDGQKREKYLKNEKQIKEKNKFRVGILTVSDKGHAGERHDASGPELARLLVPELFQVVAYQVVPDEQEAIVAQLVEAGAVIEPDLIPKNLPAPLCGWDALSA